MEFLTRINEDGSEYTWCNFCFSKVRKNTTAEKHAKTKKHIEKKADCDIKAENISNLCVKIVKMKLEDKKPQEKPHWITENNEKFYVTHGVKFCLIGCNCNDNPSRKKIKYVNCEECKPQKSELLGQAFHELSDGSFKCNWCDIRGSRQKLDMHYGYHYAFDHSCKFCSNKFANKKDFYKSHKLKCTVCCKQMQYTYAGTHAKSHS